jgi:hypothetical protein
MNGPDNKDDKPTPNVPSSNDKPAASDMPRPGINNSNTFFCQHVWEEIEEEVG